jgi:hypothetical protein
VLEYRGAQYPGYTAGKWGIKDTCKMYAGNIFEIGNFGEVEK